MELLNAAALESFAIFGNKSIHAESSSDLRSSPDSTRVLNSSYAFDLTFQFCIGVFEISFDVVDMRKRENEPCEGFELLKAPRPYSLASS